MMRKYWKMILIVLVIAVLIVAALDRLRSRQAGTGTAEVPSPTPISSSFQPNQTVSDLKGRSDFVKEAVLDGNVNILYYRSDIPDIYHKVIERNGMVLYKTTYLARTDFTYPELYGYLQTYGDYEIKGLDRLSGLDIYVYPEKGVAIVGSETANEATELYEFEPQTKEQFVTNLSEAMLQTRHQ